MANRKICTIVASRANYGRVKSLLKAIQDHPDLELQLVVGASALLYRFGQVINIIKDDGFEIAGKVYSIVEGENLTTMAKSTGLAIQELATLFEHFEPDVVLTVADRFETLGTAVAASYMNICLAHTQGGEVSGSIDESVRHAITKLAHLHFTTNEESAQILKRMGENPDRIFITGCPAIDVAKNAPREFGEDYWHKYGGVGPSLDYSAPYLVVIQHPVTTEYGAGMDQINETLAAIKQSGVQTVWLWPNVDAGSDAISKGLRVFRERHPTVPVHFYRNFSPEDYVTLMMNCACIVGNSSSAIREGAFLGTPAVNIGSRQEGRTRGKNVVDVPYDSQAILGAIQSQIKNGPYESEAIYGDGTAGEQIAKLLAEVELNIKKRFFFYP